MESGRGDREYHSEVVSLARVDHNGVPVAGAEALNHAAG